MTFAFVTFTGTAIQTAFQIIDNPSGTVERVAKVLPEMSGFFIQYLAAKCFFSCGIQLNCGLAFFQMTCRYLLRFNDATKRERMRVIAGIRRFNNPGWCFYCLIAI